MCTFSCDEGYGLTDISLITSTCNDDSDDDADGVWSSTAPECIGKVLSFLLSKLSHRTLSVYLT